MWWGYSPPSYLRMSCVPEVLQSSSINGLVPSPFTPNTVPDIILLTSQGYNLGRGVHDGLVCREAPSVDLLARRDVQKYQFSLPKHRYALIVDEGTCCELGLEVHHTSGLHKLRKVRQQEGTGETGTVIGKKC